MPLRWLVAAVVLALGGGCEEDEASPAQCRPLRCDEVCDPEREWCYFELDEGDCATHTECRPLGECKATNRCECLAPRDQFGCGDYGPGGVLVTR